MKNLKWIIGVSVAVPVLIGITMVYNGGMPVRTSVAKKGTITEYVSERGRTSLPKVYHISMPLRGRIMPIELKSGTPVKEGQVIATMDTADLESNVAELKAEMASIEAQISVSKYDALEQTAMKESTEWTATTAELIKASKKKIQANEKMYQYAAEYEKSMQQSGQAVSRIQNSQAQRDAAVAKVDLETAEITYNAMVLMDKIFNLGPTYIKQFLNRKRLQGDVLRARLAQCKTRLKRAERDLARGTIKSPIDGVILKRHVSSERVLPAGSPLLDVGDLSKLEVTANILSQQVVSIRTGNAAEIHGSAIGDAKLTGKVSRIAPEGFTKLSSLGVEQQRVKVTIAIDPDSLSQLKAKGKSLGNAFRVQVKVYTKTADNAITVPRTALFKGDSGSWELFVLDGKTAVLKTVKVGLINDQTAQILSGLNADDRVVIAPPVALANGTKVSYQ